MARVLDDVDAMLARLAVRDAPLDTATRQQTRECPRVVIAALRPLGVSEGRATELGTYRHERFAEESAVLQVAQQGSQGLIDALRLGAMVLHVPVRIPVVACPRVDQLDDADPALDQAARSEERSVGKAGR